MESCGLGPGIRTMRTPYTVPGGMAVNEAEPTCLSSQWKRKGRGSRGPWVSSPSQEEDPQNGRGKSPPGPGCDSPKTQNCLAGGTLGFERLFLAERTFPARGRIVNILRFGTTRFLTQLPSCADWKQPWTVGNDGCGCMPMKLYKNRSPIGCSLF